MDGQVTVAGSDDVVVTGDLTLDDGGNGTDVVGLIAGGYVWVYHPLDSAGENLPTYNKVRDIDAAVLSLRHSFVVQNWDQGQYLGSLHVSAPSGRSCAGRSARTTPTRARSTGTSRTTSTTPGSRTSSRRTSSSPPPTCGRCPTVTDK